MTIITKEKNINESVGKFNRVKLLAPDDYWKRTTKYLLRVTNGMGPDTWWVNVIPESWRNNILLLDVREAAIIHDYMYGLVHRSWTYEEHMNYKKLADHLFICNLLRIVENNYIKERKQISFLSFIERWFIKKRYEARKVEAYKLYELVNDYGYEAFFANKYIDSNGKIKLIIKHMEIPNEN